MYIYIYICEGGAHSSLVGHGWEILFDECQLILLERRRLHISAGLEHLNRFLCRSDPSSADTTHRHTQTTRRQHNTAQHTRARAHMHTHTQASRQTGRHTHTRTHASTHTRTHTRARTHAHTHTHTRTHTPARTHTRTHAHKHTHARTHTHTFKKRSAKFLLLTWLARVPIWPLQDILLLRVVCARINRPIIPPAHLHCPHCCNAIAQLLGNIRPPLDLPCVCHTPFNIGNNNIV